MKINYQGICLSVYVLICYFLQITANEVHAIPTQTIFFSNPNHKSHHRARIYPEIPYDYHNVSPCYLPSVEGCKKLTPDQMKQRLAHEYGSNLLAHQKHILKLYPYYASNNFIAVVKQFPQYAAFVYATARKIRNNFFFKMHMKWHGVRDVFDRLEKEVIAQEERDRRATPARRVVESQKQALRALQHEYGRPCTSKLLQQNRQHRLQALNDYFAGNDISTEQTYTLSTQAQQLISRSGIVPLPQTLVCLGNGLQQQAYQECVESINALAQYAHPEKRHNLDTFILELSALGLNAASSGLITQTYTITDFCWSAIDHVQAAGEGVYEGVINVAHMIAHPIDTAVGTARGMYEAGSFLAKLLYEVSDIAVTATYDAECAHEKSDQFVSKICAISDAITKKIKNTSSRDYVRMGVGFITESILCAQLLQASQKLYKVSKTKALAYLENPSSRVVITTAEGIELEITAHASDIIFERSGVKKFAKNKNNVGGARPEVATAYKTKNFLETT